MPLEAVKPSNDLDEYLGLIYGDQTGYVYCPTKDRSKDDDVAWSVHFFDYPAQINELKQHIATCKATLDVYIAPALFNAPKATKENVKGSHVFWVDLDGKIPTAEKMASFPAPSMIIESSDPSNKKQHWYWRLEDFCTDIPTIEKVNRGLAYAFDADVSGWDAPQVLRPPTAKNHKYGAPQTVTLLTLSPWAVNPSSFNSIPEPPKIPVEFNLDNLQDSALIIAKYEWSDQAFNHFRTRTENITNPEGRSGALMQVAYFCAEMGMQDVEIFTLLYNADERWGKFKGRPDRVRRLNDIIAKARVKHPVQISLQITDLPIMGFKSLIEADIKIEWVIPGFLEKSGQFMLSAKPGVGKSRISLQACIAMGLGKKLLHYEATEPIKLIYFSLEMGHAQVKYFLEKMAASLSKEEIKLLECQLLVVPLGQALYLDKPAGQRLVEDMLAKYEPTGYMFDSLSRMTPKSVNDEESMKVIMDWDASVRARTGIFSWFVHHNRKAAIGNKKPKDLDDLLGATVIQANATSVYTMWRDKPTDTEVEFIDVKKRLGEPEHPYIITTEPDLTFVERGILRDESLMNSDPLGLGMEPGSPEKSNSGASPAPLGF